MSTIYTSTCSRLFTKINKSKILECGVSYIQSASYHVSARLNFPEVHKRFYKNVTVAGTQKCYEVNLDHRKLKTPGGNVLKVPNYPLALAVAFEWMSVEEKIMPCWMHLTGLSFTVSDNPQKLSKSDMIDTALSYLETDTLLFREDTKEDFLELQTKEWDPILEWFNKRFESDLKPSTGLYPGHITEECQENIRRYLASYNMWAASGIVYGVEAIKSIILTLACLERKISSKKAVQLALLETEFQAQNWGTVEWSHDVEKSDLEARFSAAVLFVQLNSSEYVVKRLPQK